MTKKRKQNQNQIMQEKNQKFKKEHFTGEDIIIVMRVKAIFYEA